MYPSHSTSQYTIHAARVIALLALVAIIAVAGCSSVPKRDTAAPCNVPSMRDGGYRSNKVSINFIRLRQDRPPAYVLGSGDTLGIYIECVVPKVDEPPPVHYPEPGSPLPPAIGYPFPIREDGTISLPYVPPIRVAGLTLVQTEREIRSAYSVKRKILNPDRDKIIVSLLKPRTYQIMVIREDTTESFREGRFQLGSQRRGETRLVDLRAYENDILHALMESGGLPGVEAKNELVILRGSFNDAIDRNGVIDNRVDYNQVITDYAENGAPNILRIPLRVDADEQLPVISKQDIILGDGDIVFIQSRDAEVFYTGGLLIGGQYPLPRNYDLDVLGAIAMSGGSIAAAAGGSGTVGSGRGGVGSIFPPTRILVIREFNGCQKVFEMDIKQALCDPSKRILIEPNDFIMMEYTPMQVVCNVVLNNLQVNLSLSSFWE